MSKDEINFYPISPLDSISTFVSTAATSLVLIIGISYGVQKKPLEKMVMIVNFLDLIFCLTKLSVFIYAPKTTAYCRVLQVFSQASLLASVMWGTFFGHVLFIVAKYQTMQSLQSSFRWYVGISIFFGGGLGLATAFTNFVYFSPDHQTCVHPVWFGKFDTLNFIFAILPIGSCCIVGIIWYVLASKVLEYAKIVLHTRELLALLIYPGIVLFCWLPQIVFNIMGSFGFKQNEILSAILQNILLLQGFFDALIYGIAPSVRRYCNKRKAQEEESSSNPLPLNNYDDDFSEESQDTV